MSYLKSVPLNLSNWNILQKKKKSKFGPKNVLFGYFWSRILKNIVIFEINTLKFVKNESLTRTANFVIGFAFSKGPGSTFSEFPAPLYKVSFFLHSNNKTGVLRNFAKFTWKHLSQSLFFDKVADLRLATLLKKRLWHRCFPMHFVKFLRTPFLIEHLWWLLLGQAKA